MKIEESILQLIAEQDAGKSVLCICRTKERAEYISKTFGIPAKFVDEVKSVGSIDAPDAEKYLEETLK